MSKPKLSPQAKSTLKAVNVLLAYYKGGYKEGPKENCPLCDVSEETCFNCPWVIFEGNMCMQKTARYKLGIVTLSYTAPLYWRRASIKRLARWARLIKNGAYDRKLKEAKS